MKKILAILCLALCFLPLTFTGCKKKEQTVSKTFTKYFHRCTAVENERSTTYTTESIFEIAPAAYSSLKFTANKEWTEGLNAEYVVLELFANKDADIDMMFTFTTNEDSVVVPILVSAKANETVEFEVSLNKTLSGDTTLLFELTDVGGVGLVEDGLLYDTNGVATNFVWKICGAKLFGSHEANK